MRTRRKRKLGQFLETLRKRAGKDVDELAREIRKSQPSTSKYLNGYLLIGWADLGVWLDVLGADEDERGEAHRMWEDAKQDSKRVEHPAAYNPKARAFARAEADAATVRQIEPLIVPGLLQISSYAAAVREAAHLFVNPSVNTNRAVAAQASRQKNLHGPDALQLHTLIGEPAITGHVGGPSVMHDQLVHLLKMTALDNITLQVIPQSAGAYGTMSGGGSTILGFEDDSDPDAVYLEFPTGGVWVEEEPDVEKFVKSFDEVVAVALTPEESAEFIRARADDLSRMIEDEAK
jgi:transcriptional regulator with XRE-family HTH domain